MHSSDRVLPEYQHPQIGDTLGYGKNRMRFERVEPERSAGDTLRGRQLGLELRARRAERKDAADQPKPLSPPIEAAKIGMLPMEPGSLLMERKMLRGIKQRAERLAAEAKEESRV